MKAQEPNNLLDQRIDEAIADDLKQQPGVFHVQKIMSNIYSVSKSREVFKGVSFNQNFTFRMALIYGVSIAASICIGYFIGSINISPSDNTMMMVNFENTNINTLISF